MRNFALQLDTVRPPAVGLIAGAADRQTLHRKIKMRAGHYSDMSVAIGDEWTAFFSDGGGQQVELPWIDGAVRFLYELVPGCLCELGYRPNTPMHLNARLLVKLRQTHAAQGTIAILSADTRPQIFDLSEARALSQVDLGILS